MKKGMMGVFWMGAVLVGGLSASGAGAANVEKLVAVCADCHGKNGSGTETDVPIIGGYSVGFLENNLKAYKSKDRDCPETKFRAGAKKGQKGDMCQMVKDLSPADITEVAKYFSKQKFVRAKQKFDPALAKKGKEIHEQLCEKCHSEGGTRADDDVGLPAGQWMPYLRQALDEFKSGKRPVAKKMKVKMDEVDKAGLEALVNYYGSFK